MNTSGSENRRAFIRREIEIRGSVSVGELSEVLGVSDMTIRRDLADLEKEGAIRRVYGGAVSMRGRSYEPARMLRATENYDAKCRIGERAAQLIADGASVALDVGTTTLEIARYLQGRRNLTIITPSLHIANLLFTQPDIRLILTGGIARPGEGSLIGDLAQRAFEGLFVDQLFLGVGGIDSQVGFTEYNWDDALVKQAMIRSAKEVIVVADSSKFERVAFAGVGPLSIAHQVVTDRAPSPDLSEALKRSGIVVHVATADEPEYAIPLPEV